MALLGATGAGKTSLINLLPRFYDYTSGQILLDGVELKQYPRRFLRRHIGIVEQEPFLFSRTVRENIVYGVGHDVPQEQIEAAARAAAIHDVILTKLPDGYDTLVGERGTTLSGGQKQRVAIARTLLKDPRILILDDSTSSVDTETEAAIRQALETLMENRTTFIIAHRIQSVMNADLILVMNKGRIIQAGKHDDLVNQDGMYRRIFLAQRASKMNCRRSWAVSDHYEFEEEEFTTQFNGQTIRRILAQAMPHWPYLVGFLIFIALTAVLDAFLHLSEQADHRRRHRAQRPRRAHQNHHHLRLADRGAGRIRLRFHLSHRLARREDSLRFAQKAVQPSTAVVAVVLQQDAGRLDYVTRATSDTERVAELVTWGLVDTAWGVLNISTSLVFMAFIDWRLALIVSVTIPVIIVVAFYFKKRIIVEYRQVRKVN